MADYISRQAVIRLALDGKIISTDMEKCVRDFINELPAADVQPIKFGKWIEDGCITKCNQCGEKKRFPHWSFCPNCGAMMSESLKGKYYGKLIVEGLRAVIEARDSQMDKSEWIPVEYHQITEKERQENDYPEDWVYCLDSPMPEEGQEILITITGGYVEKDTCFNDGEGYYSENGYDWCGDIKAWMPLPEPYHAESEDK